MAMSDADLVELESSLRKARQKPVAYGLCLGKKPEDNVIYLDLKKSSEVVMRRAKADGETGKITHGMASVDGKVLTLTVEGKMLPGLAKNMKQFMSRQGMKMKVVITDANGVELENDGEDEDDVASPTAQEPPREVQPTGDDGGDTPDDLRKEQWAKVAAALDPHVQRFLASGHPKTETVKAAWTAAGAAAAKGDYASSLTVAAKIKPLVATPQPAPPADKQPEPQDAAADAPSGDTTDPNQGKWNAERDALEQVYTAAMARNPANRTQLEAAWAMANEKAGAGDFAAAMQIANKIRPILGNIANQDSSGQEKEIPADVVPFQKSRVLWVGTRQKMLQEMKKLEDAISATIGGDPDLASLLSEVGTLTGRLSSFDEQLQDILDEITNSPAGDAREALKKSAIAKIREYAAILDEPFFKDVDSNNGFTNVLVASSARASLAQIAKVLAA